MTFPSRLSLLPLLFVLACGDQTAGTSALVGSWSLVASDGLIADVTARPSVAPFVGPVPIGEVREHLFPSPGATLKVSENDGTPSLRYIASPCDLELEIAGAAATLVPGESCSFQWTLFHGGTVRIDRHLVVFIPSSLTLTLDVGGHMLEESVGPCRLDLRTEENGVILVDQTFDCTLARTFTWERREAQP